MNALGYVASAFVAAGSIAWTITSVAARFDRASADFHPPAPASCTRALPEARARRVSGFKRAINMLLLKNAPALPVRLRAVPLARRADPVTDVESRDLAAAHYYKRCSICGEPLGQYKAFVVSPLVAIDRVCGVAPSHQDCAKFAASNNTRPLSADVVMVWVTRSYEIVSDNMRVQIRLGDAEQVFWFLDGRRASRDDVRASFEAALPALYDAAHGIDQRAVLELDTRVARAVRLFPAHAAARHVS